MGAPRVFRADSQTEISVCCRTLLGVRRFMHWLCSALSSISAIFPARGSTSIKISATPLQTMFMVDDLLVNGSHGNCGCHLPDKLFAGFIHADYRIDRVKGQLANLQDAFHPRHKSGAAIGWNLPVLAQVRTQFVFLRPNKQFLGAGEFSCRPMLIQSEDFPRVS